MIFGVSYYPEITPETEWAADLDRLREAGFTVVRVGEFAWSAFEPREGEYHFEWMDRFLDAAQARGLSVVLGTPTASPPAWLIAQYPQILVQLPDGVRLGYGERRACCVNSEIYRQFSVEIAARLGDRYGRHPAVIGWQIDNELIGPERPRLFECHCADCVWRFRQWLKRKYPSPQAVNDAWGLRFWSLEFSDWGEVAPPLRYRACPGHALDYHRFYSDSLAEYLRLQYEALRARVEARQFVSHNSTAVFDRGIDHRSFARTLNAVGWDAYPGAASAGHGPNPAATALAHDWFRSMLRRPFWIWETTPAAVHDAAFFAEMRARGAHAVLFWLWRTHRANMERGSRSFCDFDGKPYAARLRQVRQLRERLAAVAPSLPSPSPRAPAALLFDPDNVRAEHRLERRPMPYLEGVIRAYLPFWRHGVATDAAHPGDDLTGYRLAIAPGLRLMDEADARALERFVRDGGVLLIFGPAAHLDRHGVYYRRWGEPLSGLLDGVVQPETLPTEGVEIVTSAGENFVCRSGDAEIIRAPNDADILARFRSGPHAGSPAAFTRVVGRGHLFYAATSACAELNRRLARPATERAGLEWVEHAFDDVGVLVEPNGRGRWIFNHGNAPARVLGVEVPPRDFAFLASSAAGE